MAPGRALPHDRGVSCVGPVSSLPLQAPGTDAKTLLATGLLVSLPSGRVASFFSPGSRNDRKFGRVPACAHPAGFDPISAPVPRRGLRIALHRQSLSTFRRRVAWTARRHRAGILSQQSARSCPRRQRPPRRPTPNRRSRAPTRSATPTGPASDGRATASPKAAHAAQRAHSAPAKAARLMQVNSRLGRSA